MKTVDAFMKGYKPAFLEIPNSKWTTKHLGFLQKNYPYTDESEYDLLNGRQFYLFFQDESTRLLFQQQMKKIAFDELEIDRLLGEILGFPPKAIHYYVRMWKEKVNGNLTEFEQLQNRKIGLIYCGCSFASDVNDLMENVSWLLERYPYEEAKEDGMFVRIEGERISVPIGDLRQLREFQEYILSQCEVVLVGAEVWKES